ncbi:MGMT family protein [Kordiimonas sp. SCSIO 12603]|uniref:MGMT family protein n=1 Tax=Kordiimonas sp. SCSIO 12603 TaxID=2829596 RepID=UPI0021039117|nr:MGMT family protein [Kordiimonas sp. SCSIO 12603]UTW58702.1 MGMT family protein [Kordiimonas sp. SCSIO 12603]
MRQYSSFPQIYELVKLIPEGRVASYGMIASLITGATPRIVGFAMAGVGAQDVPWHRVINSAGKISEREGADRQRQRLEEEGVVFSKAGKIKWKEFGWAGPEEDWAEKTGMEFFEFLEITAKWPVHS